MPQRVALTLEASLAPGLVTMVLSYKVVTQTDCLPMGHHSSWHVTFAVGVNAPPKEYKRTFLKMREDMRTHVKDLPPLVLCRATV